MSVYPLGLRSSMRPRPAIMRRTTAPYRLIGRWLCGHPCVVATAVRGTWLGRLNLLGAFADFERTLTRERQREGIRLAQAAGKYKGRSHKLTAEQLVDARRLFESGVPKRRSPGPCRSTGRLSIGLSLATLQRGRRGSEAPHACLGMGRLVPGT